MSVIRVVEDYWGINAWQSRETNASRGCWRSRGDDESKMTKQCGEELVNTDMKIAMMTSTLPAVIQDFVHQHVDSKTKYADISEKVKAWVGIRVAMAHEPIPMDIGEVGWSSDDCNMQAEETEIYLVASAWTKCHRCVG